MNTRTFKDFSEFLGRKPARIGLVATLYDQFTMTHLTESLMNIYTSEKAAKNNWQRLNEFVYEWELEVNRIKRVPLVAEPEGNGENVSDIIFRFPENWYQKYDQFIAEDTRQLFAVMNRPQRIADNCYLCICKLVTNDYSEKMRPLKAGSLTRFVTNAMPEMH